MERLKIYFIHSTKFDYNNLIYKQLLSSGTCITQELMLPMSSENKGKYAKDLIAQADIVIAEVSHPSFGLGLELKWLSKVDKPKLFLSLDNKVPSNYRKYITDITMTTDKLPYIKIVENFINENIELKKPKDAIITLGEI